MDATAPKTTIGTGSAILPHDLSPWGMFLNADIVVKAVMVGLAFASLVTWTILLAKSIELAGARSRAGRGLSDLAGAATLRDAAAKLGTSNAPVTRFVAGALAETDRSRGLSNEGIKDRATALLSRIETRAGRAMARGTGLLATIGSTAPFVGLFGTVWGIMNAFIGISKTNTTNLAVVAPGIAEALLATAFGLVAAIPAVIIYNVFARAITGYRSLLGDASTEVMRLLSRDLDREDAVVSGRSIRARPSSPMASKLASSDTDDLVETHEINVTPFIDVILVLLIIFMVAAPLSTVDVAVDLPASTATPAPRPDKPIFVTLKEDKTIALGEETVASAALGPALDQVTSGDKEKRVFVRADKAVSYGDVMSLMNTLRDDGYLKIGLVGLDAGKHADAPPSDTKPDLAKP